MIASPTTIIFFPGKLTSAPRHSPYKNGCSSSLWPAMASAKSIHTVKIQHISMAVFEKNSSTPSPNLPSPSAGFKLRRPLPLTLPPASTSGGTRWNPTEEQIRMLESLYNSGVRTPNAQQIERITSELVSHGRIEGKNVFYWFQNHKARERQRQKRSAAILPHGRRSILDKLGSPSPAADFIFSDTKEVEEEEERNIDEGILKRRRTRSLELDFNGCRTLHLFPLTPENINGS